MYIRPDATSASNSEMVDQEVLVRYFPTQEYISVQVYEYTPHIQNTVSRKKRKQSKSLQPRLLFTHYKLINEYIFIYLSSNVLTRPFYRNANLLLSLLSYTRCIRSVALLSLAAFLLLISHSKVVCNYMRMVLCLFLKCKTRGSQRQKETNHWRKSTRVVISISAS